MRRILCLVVLPVILILSASPVYAVEGSEVRLRSSTLPGTVPDTIGQFDLTFPEKLVFRAPGRPDIAIPYTQITEFSYRTEVTHHLGVAGAIAVGLIKKRQRQHFVTLSYHDGPDTVQLASFEVSKTAPDILVSLLRAKARSACERREYGACTPVVPLRPVSAPAPRPLP